jgi:ABC-2 type transport system ATP-binding protein
MSTHQMHQVEALCDRIVLINQGSTVLYGPVSEIKRNFAGNAISIEGQGDFGRIPGVLETQNHNGNWHLALEIGVDPQRIFRALAARDNVKVERFELAEPSLDDIFVQVVSDRGSQDKAADAQPRPLEVGHA